jgi:hypothetical protein
MFLEIKAQKCAYFNVSETVCHVYFKTTNKNIQWQDRHISNVFIFLNLWFKANMATRYVLPLVCYWKKVPPQTSARKVDT